MTSIRMIVRCTCGADHAGLAGSLAEGEAAAVRAGWSRVRGVSGQTHGGDKWWVYASGDCPACASKEEAA